MTNLLTDVPERALAVYAHPDDREVSCGGTLAQWASHGAEVRLVAVDAGDKGSHESRMAGDPELVAELRRLRTAEIGAQAGVRHAESFRRLRFG